MHEKAKRGDSRLPATGANRHGYAKTGVGKTPSDFNGKEGVDGSSPSEGSYESSARQVGLTSGSFYHHWPTREAYVRDQSS